MHFISNNFSSNYIFTNFLFYCSHDNIHDHDAVELNDNRSVAF